MKKFLFCLFLFLLIVLLVGCSIGTFAFPFDDSEYDTEMLSVSETNEDTYYLRKTPEKITFNITSKGPHAEPEYLISDSSGNVVSSNLKTSSNTFEIVAPENGYVPGERYTLTLGDNTVFNDENLKDAQTLVFSIGRDPVENYEFTKLVKEQSSVITEISDTVVSMEGLNAVQGDIIFGKNAADDYVAYKIEEILSDGTAAVSAPALDEIYSVLEVYGDYQFDVSDIVANPDLEAEIEENIRKSDFFSLLSTTAYAADSPTAPL